MRLILVTGFFILALLSVFCSAQNNQTESITITTYFPAPFGVYKNLRLVERSQPAPSDTAANQAGTMYFDNDQHLYIYNSSSIAWEPIGSGGSGGSGGTAWKILSGTVSPDQCSGSGLPWPSAVSPQLCPSGYFYMDILFPANTFTTTPHVVVMPLEFSDQNLVPCSQGETDTIIAYPGTITPSGFRLWAAGSPWDCSDCVAAGGPNDAYTRVLVKWIAIGE